jgi:hypothetical protein
MASPVPIWMIRPHPAARMAGRNPWMHRTAAATLTWYSASQSSGVASSQPRLTNTAALLTRMSTPPAASTLLMNRAQAAGLARSATRPQASPPSAEIASTTSLIWAASRPCTTTAAPSAARVRAMASPIPPLDPVITARRPLSCRSTVSSRAAPPR